MGLKVAMAGVSTRSDPRSLTDGGKVCGGPGLDPRFEFSTQGH